MILVFQSYFYQHEERFTPLKFTNIILQISYNFISKDYTI